MREIKQFIIFTTSRVIWILLRLAKVSIVIAVGGTTEESLGKFRERKISDEDEKKKVNSDNET